MTHPSAPSRHFVPFCPRSSTVLSGLLVLLIAGLAPSAQAQTAASPSLPDTPRDRVEKTESSRPYWKAHFDEQIAHMLRDAPSDVVRATLLHTVIDLAIDEGDINVATTVPSLLYIVKHDEDPQRRLLALQALDLLHKHTSYDLDRSATVRLHDLLQKESTVAVRRAGASMLKAVDTIQ